MIKQNKNIRYFGIMALLLIIVGVFQSWNVSLSILNLCLISAIMALGVNMQWGYAGLFNVGIMGFAALGGLAAVLIAQPAVQPAWQAAGTGLWLGLGIFIATVIVATVLYRKLPKSLFRMALVTFVSILGYILLRIYFDPVTHAIEKVEPAKTGYLGGLGLPVLLAWPVGGALAGAVAWVIGKITLGLRSDYLAIATLGISEIIVAVLKHEDWMSRGVKNVVGLPRPVPYETNLQASEWFQTLAASLGADVVGFSSIFVKLCYAGLFAVVLILFLYLSEKALKSPWGRMMRAIRDNEVSANAMGKNVTARHLQVFVLGSVVIGVAGAMLTTLDGQLTPSSYQPLRFTFLIWVMVIVGGSGNNMGAVLGGFIIWFFWIEAEPMGLWLMNLITSGMDTDSDLRAHLIDSAAHMRLITMGMILLLALRFRPRGLLPER
ncbi:branched-chain amino acid ABC transporter permease [Amylibacter marinus]|uniref:Branched-chain amino acid ABC transporter permease n=1 Tax=Amylibacter marinus TaxID=1475483 RepID=A0ABQ5VRH2_9RHOB|nr:branched-chain amino acid ABC transporter permease [Amylibacter marinus]GLQ33939.1 branched-chain amino acid ABC transporter permease [Amylibacter marinus]